MSSILEEKRKAIEDAISSHNEQLRENNHAGMAAMEAKMKEAERDYANQVQLEAFSEFVKADNPMLAAVQKFQIYVIGHSRKTENGVFRGYKIKESVPKPIDFVKFCQYAGLSTDWQRDVERLNVLLCMRVNVDFGHTEKEIMELEDLFYLEEFGKEVRETGCNLVSNNHISRVLQKILDKILFVPGDENPKVNKYRCGKSDVSFLRHAYTTYDKRTVHCVKVQRIANFKTILFDIFNRIVNDADYDVTGFKTALVAPAKADEKAEEKADGADKPAADGADAKPEAENPAPADDEKKPA